MNKRTRGIEKRLAIIFSISLAACTTTGNVYAEMYKWTDNDGTLHFSDMAPDVELTQSVNAAKIETAKKTPALVEPNAIYRGNLQRSGAFLTRGLETQPKIKWKFKLDNVFIYPSSVVATDSTVYVAGDKDLYAIESSTGKLKWKFPIDKGASPVSVLDGMVYFSSGDKNLYAVNAESGREIWRYTTGLGTHISPAVTAKTVFVGSGSPTKYSLYNGYLYAVNRETGDENWKFKTSIYAGTHPAVYKGIVYFGNTNWDTALSFYGDFFAVDAITGEKKWSFTTPANLTITASPAASNGVVFIGGGGNFRGCLFALDAGTGKERWKFDTRGRIETSPAISDGTVFFGTSENQAGTLYAVNIETGHAIWSLNSRHWIESSPAVVEKTLYFGAGKELFAVDTLTGKQKWRYELAGNINSNSPMVADGVIYISTSDGYIYALEE